MTAEAAKAASRAEVKETMFPESMHRSLVMVSPNSAYCMVLILRFDVATAFQSWNNMWDEISQVRKLESGEICFLRCKIHH
jgi:hypothetical protein